MEGLSPWQCIWAADMGSFSCALIHTHSTPDIRRRKCIEHSRIFLIPYAQTYYNNGNSLGDSATLKYTPDKPNKVILVWLNIYIKVTRGANNFKVSYDGGLLLKSTCIRGNSMKGLYNSNYYSRFDSKYHGHRPQFQTMSVQ